MRRYIERFDKCCNDFYDGKIILAETRVEKLLKCIAGESELLQLAESSLENFDYQVAFQSCVKIVDGRTVFVLPKEHSKIVPLVLKVLYDIDNKTLDFFKFMHDYFSETDDKYASYKKFCDSVILPFQKAMLSMVNGASTLRTALIINSHKKGEMDDLVKLIRQLIVTIDADRDIDKIRKEEGIFIANAFANEVIKANNEQIKIMWIGLKNTVRDCPKVNKLLFLIKDRLMGLGVVR